MDQTPVQSFPPETPYLYSAPQNPIAGTVKVFGIIYAVFAALSVLSILSMLAMQGAMRRVPANPQVPNPMLTGAIFTIIAVFVAVIFILYSLTAYGLLARKSWGRILLIVVSILSLISIPIGTILGACGLYFFLRTGAAENYARLTLGQP